MAKLIVRGTRKRDTESFTRCLQVCSMRPGEMLSLVTHRNVQLDVDRFPRGYRIRSDEVSVATPTLSEEVALDCLRRLGAL